MAINFPHNPNVNDVHTESSLGRSWKWDGTSWKIYSSTTTGIGFSDLSVQQQAASGTGSLSYNNANGVFTYIPPVVGGGGGGSSTFVGLTDTPTGLTADKWLKVNAGGTALEFTNAPSGYTLPTASVSTLGGVKIDGTTITINGSGVISGSPSVPTSITVADESTETECYPLFSTAATGDIAPKTGTNIKFNSSSGQLEAGSFKKTGGSASEFLKADGSIDSNTYSQSNHTHSSSPEIVWTLTANGVADYIFSGDGFPTGTTDPDITLIRGQTYKFTNNTGGHPFRIQSNPAQVGGGTQYNSGVTNNDANGASNQTLIFVVPMNAPSTLYYQCTVHPAMTGTINILDASVTSPALNDLSNVDATTNLANGKILKYDLGSTTWVVADDNASGGGSSSFTGLSDTPSAHSNDKWLKSDGSALIWADAPAGDNTTFDLTGVATSNGFKTRLTGSDSTIDDVEFTPGGGISYTVTGNTCQISSVNTISGLSDTTITGSPTDNYVLTYDSASSKWEPQPVPSGSTPTLNAVLGAGNTSTTAATVGDFTCSNLTVNGTTTTVNSNTVNIGDNILVLNSDETGTPSQNGGLEIERGTSTNVSLRWNETTDKWQFTNDGSSFSDIGDSEGEANVQVDWNQTTTSADDFIKNKPTLFSGAYSDLTGKPTLFSGSYNDLSDKPTITNTTYDLTGVATSNGVKVRLTGSDSTTDDVEFTPGGGISYSVSGSTVQISSINSLSGLSDTNIGGSPSTGDVLVYQNNQWEAGAAGSGIPAGTIVMYGGNSAPSGWLLCNGQSTSGYQALITLFGGNVPDLRDKFVIGSGNSYNWGATGGYNDAIVVSHNHNANAGNQSANHSHYINWGTGSTGDHYHQQGGSGSGTTGNQSANHYHTIGGNKPDGSPGTWTANTSGGTHGHGFQTTNSHPQSNMSGIKTEGGDGGNINNSYIQSSGGSHNHSINLTGITTGGIDQNHTHNFSFNVSGNTTYASIGDHSHNVTGNTGGNSANHNHNISIGTEGSSGSGRNLPPYFAITFIVKT